MQTQSDTSTSCPARSQSGKASKRLELHFPPELCTLAPASEGTSPAWPYRQLILVTPHPSALPLFDHSFDVHQHWQGHTARSKAEEQSRG